MAEFRTRKALVDGVLLIDKPVGLTSHDVVARVRRKLRPAVSKVGHAGTLDPFATGLLVVLVGRATKLARFFVDLPKEYVCTMKFGVRSDTGDHTGALTPSGLTTTRAAVEAVLPKFLGNIAQRVPMTSAVKVDGERLYRKAHRGEVVETPVKEVEITAIDILSFDEATQEMRCHIACSKGTYVRQLAIDVGEAVGVGAHLEEHLAHPAIPPGVEQRVHQPAAAPRAAGRGGESDGLDVALVADREQPAVAEHAPRAVDEREIAAVIRSELFAHHLAAPGLGPEHRGLDRPDRVEIALERGAEQALGRRARSGLQGAAAHGVTRFGPAEGKTSGWRR